MVWVINATLPHTTWMLGSNEKKRHLKQSSFDSYSLTKTSSQMIMQKVFHVIFIDIYKNIYLKPPPSISWSS